MSISTLTRGWELDPATAPADGPVAFGGDLDPESLLEAYRGGVYPFPATSPEHSMINELTYEADVADGRVAVLGGGADPFGLAWCSPDPRPVLRAGHLRVQRSLRQQLRNRTDWHTTADRCFDRVVESCRAGRSERWLTDDLVAALGELHRAGHAHSVEVWDGDELIGGVYGVRVGPVFSADSQFTTRSGAGKVAVVDLARRFGDAGGQVVDVQRDSDHARLLGAHTVSRRDYLATLDCGCDTRGCRCTGALDPGRAPARRLAECRCPAPGPGDRGAG